MRFSRRRPMLLSMLALASATAAAQPYPAADVPPSLRPWTTWVLDQADERLCPAVGGQAACLWPGRLKLDAGAGGARFELLLSADRALAVPLPGGDKRWPQDVKLDGQPAAVLASKEGLPVVRVARGAHRLEGRFVWERLPDALPVPTAIGIVDLTVEGRALAFPRRDQGGLLSLRDVLAAAASGENLQLHVQRRLQDGIPLTIETRLALDVSGRAREVALRGALLAGASALGVSGDLPARLDPDGTLRVQVRAGSFKVLLLARLEGRPERFSLPPSAPPWPSQEVWVFAANERLRQVQAGGAPPIDPSRTDLPDEWRALPAFLMEGQAALLLNEVRRGEPEAAPDQLSLARTLWLDQDGRGFSVHDGLSGRLGRSSRLDLVAPGELGRVQVGGDGQLITQEPGSGRPGVELRKVAVALEADSRLPRSGALPAVGWSAGVQSLQAELRLPPGWRLLGASGVDKAQGAWVSSWNLFAFFFVLITALAADKLLGRRWGLLALLTLVLLHGESQAPRLAWLSLLAALALRRAVAAGLARKLAGAWWVLSLLVLVFAGVPFLVGQVRTGLYPQTAEQAAGPGDFGLLMTRQANEAPAPQAVPAAPAPEPTQAQDEEKAKTTGAFDRSMTTRQRYELNAPSSYGFSAPTKAYQQDPHAVIQTGTGLPNWSWVSYSLQWSGPVASEQRMRLFLLSPGVNLVLAVLRVLLTLALALRLLAAAYPTLADRLRALRAAPPAAALLALLVLLPAPPGAAQEEPTPPAPAAGGLFPSPELLEELKQRLLRAPVCAPDCVSTARLHLALEGGELRFEAEVHAGAAAAWPVPGPAESWVPRTVVLDGAPGEGRLARLANGFLHLRLDAGVHTVRLAGPLPPRDSVTLQFGERPRRASASAPGWQVDGIREDGSADDSVQLSRRLAAGAAAAASSGGYAPWLEVTRILDIGVTWEVETIVRRVSPPGAPLVVKVPLLKGMLVTDAERQVKDGEVLVNLGRDETEVRWSASLPPVEGTPVTLLAPQGKPWSEVWIVRCGPVWQCQAGGLPPVDRTAAGALVPEFRPWPGEKLELVFHRPPGLAGQTLTIETARLALAPGERLEDGTLDLSLRASRTTPLALTLPPGSEVQELKLGGAARPIRPDGSKLTLTIGPGAHELHVAFRRPGGVSWLQRAPAVDLGQPAVNAHVTLSLPDGRWLLFTGGPAWGPAVLFWGYLGLLLLFALALARFPGTPLGALEWLLLGLGLTQLPLFGALVVAGWFLALAWRRERVLARPIVHNLLQLALLAWTLLALGFLYAAVYDGLLLRPDMLVEGAGSSASSLQWYQDRVAGALPQPWALSLPLWTYRVAMLLWSLWLALRLLRWIPWGFASFVSGAAWKRAPRKPAPPAPPVPPPPPPPPLERPE